ncbi:MAG: GNAT family N-acetyltransferase [Jatrophihabitantaceae bacterium]
MRVEWGYLTDGLVEGWAELTNLLAKVDQTEEFYEAADLAEELVEPGVDPSQDTIAVSVDGMLVGFGQLRVAMELFEGKASAWLGGGVHPDYRGCGLGVRIMDQLEQRAVELAGRRHPASPVLLKVSGGVEGSSVRPMLAHRGYQTIRFYHELERQLPGEPIPEPALPVQRYAAELAGSTLLAHNDAFSTHWGSTPRTEEQWQDLLASRTFRPEASYVSLAEDGSVDAYVFVRQWVEGEAWIETVGCRQRARGRGLARACLSASLRAAVEQGYRTAALSVDSENGQGAGALYSSLGFGLQRVIASYGKLVDAGR